VEGSQAAAAKGNHGGRPKVIDDDMLLFARALHDQDTSMPDIVARLTIKTGKNAANTPRSRRSTARWAKLALATSHPVMAGSVLTLDLT
jgi:hypothetical protein